MRRTSMNFLPALITLIFLAGCGGGTSTHSISVDGEPAGEGECSGNQCDFVFGAPTLQAKSADDDPLSPMVLAPSESERLDSGASSFQVTRDDEPVLGLRVLPSGQVTQQGEPAGHVRPDGLLVFD